MRIPFAENPRFPGPGSSPQGKSGPKARPKGVVDGKQVNIPVPPCEMFDDEGGRRMLDPPAVGYAGSTP